MKTFLPAFGFAFSHSGQKQALSHTSSSTAGAQINGLNAASVLTPPLPRRAPQTANAMRTHGLSTSRLFSQQDGNQPGVWIDPLLLDIAEKTPGQPTDGTQIKQSDVENPATLPPRNTRAEQYTNSIINILKMGEAFAPGVMDLTFDRLREAIKSSIKPESIIGQLSLKLIDIAQDQKNDPVKYEAFYFLFVTLEILNAACDQRIDDEGNSLPTTTSSAPVLQSLLLGQFDKIISNPAQFDPTGFLKLYDSVLNGALGDQKNFVYSTLRGLKTRVVDAIKQEDPNSLRARVNTGILLGIAKGLDLEVEVEDIVNDLQDLGIPATKLSQTIAGLLEGNDLVKGDVFLERLLQACKIVQQFTRPMSREEAEKQMARQYESKLGPNWKSKLFQEIDFSKPFRAGTIACIYRGIALDGRQVCVKVQKPDLEREIKRDRAQSQQLISAAYKLLQEAKYAYVRAGVKVPDLLSQADSFQKSEAQTNNFFVRFLQELNFETEAKTMMSYGPNGPKTPKILSYGELAIIMEFIENGMTPSAYLALSKETQAVNYQQARSATEAVQGWLKSHLPLPLKSGGIHVGQPDDKVKISFKDDKQPDVWLQVKKEKTGWQIEPLTPCIDFSAEARRMIAAQFIVDLSKQLFEELVNGDAHDGNFLIAPKSEKGKNELYHIDFGLTGRVDGSKREIATLFIRGVITRNAKDIARAYLKMSDEGSKIADTPNSKELAAFMDVLKKADYFEQLTQDPDQAMGPVMTWLSDNDFPPSDEYFVLIRSFAGVASNAATMQNGDPISPRQLQYLSKELGKLYLDKQVDGFLSWLKSSMNTSKAAQS